MNGAYPGHLIGGSRLRPGALIFFEISYFGSLFVSILNAAVYPEEWFAGADGFVTQIYFMTGGIVGLYILLGLFVSLRRSVIAKWLIVLDFTASVAMEVIYDFTPIGSTALYIIDYFLYAAAVALLFAPSMRSWMRPDSGNGLALQQTFD